MWKCPVCGKTNQAMQCSCGFDESRNYTKYPTLMSIYSGTVPSSLKPSQTETQAKETKQTPHKEQKPTMEQEQKPQTRKAFLKCAAWALLILLVFLGLRFLPQQPPDEPSLDYPSGITMTSDCSAVLSEAGHSGAVLELQVQSRELNERFMVLTIVCSAEVLEDNQQKQYVVELLYDYVDDAWQCSDLSKVKKR